MAFFWSIAKAGRNRDSTHREDDKNDLPSLMDLLHPTISSENISWEDVAACVMSHPHEVVQRRNYHTPLKLALQHEAPSCTIQLFLQLAPEAAKEVTQIGMTPLHLAVAQGAPLDTVRYILEAWPHATSQKMNDGSVPLHSVRNAETARLLIDACPKSLYMKNNAGYLPLHRVAYANYASPETVQCFLCAEEAFWERSNANRLTNYLHLHDQQSQLMATTITGMTPLEAAMEEVERDLSSPEEPIATSSTKWKKMEMLARGRYRAETTCTARDCDPSTDTFCLLNILLQYGASVSLLQYALAKNRKILGQRDHRGRSALSMAASIKETPPETIAFLVEHGREMAQWRDGDGRLPLHLAIASGRTFADDGVETLWKAWPPALEMVDPVTRLDPYLLAAAVDAEIDGDVNPSTRLDTIYRIFHDSPWLVPETAAEWGDAAIFSESPRCKNQVVKCWNGDQDVALSSKHMLFFSSAMILLIAIFFGFIFTTSQYRIDVLGQATS